MPEFAFRNIRLRKTQSVIRRKRTAAKLVLERLEARRLLTFEIEPNNTPATATIFTANASIEGVAGNIRDLDYFKINLTSGSRLTVDTSNIRDPLFTPSLPPSLQILDGAGNVLSASKDGRDVSFTANRTADYFVRMDPDHAFGTLVETYAMQSTLTNFTGVNEAEPNNSIGQATAARIDELIRGATSAGDSDFFSVNLSAGDTVLVDFAGIPAESPNVRILNSAGGILATGTSGLGTSLKVNTAGTYFIEVSGGSLGQYAAVINRHERGTLVSDLGDSLDNAIPIDVTGYRTTTINELSNLQDIDVYSFETTGLEDLEFRLARSSGDIASASNRLMTLYNQFGQLLAYSTDGILSTARNDATYVGTYFLAISSTALTGLGLYGLTVTNIDWFSTQRDVGLQFIDFNRQRATHQGFAWVASYGVPEAIPFIVGMFDSRYSTYDVDVTLQAPTETSELVVQGYGNFGNIGAGGYGGGFHGIRRTNGTAVSSANETSWTSLSYNSSMILNHEFGHASGLPHAALANSLMSYEGTEELLPIGDGYSFMGTDSRRPGPSRINQRNYLDWSTQAGSQAFDLEPNSTLADAQSIDGYFKEMTADFHRNAGIATGDAPNQVLSGDFNGDGRRDLVISSVESDDLRVYLGNGSGGFTANAPIRVDDMGWWTEPMVVADFNRDGRSDVVMISSGLQRGSILLAGATGVLGNPVTFNVGSFPQSVAAGDINRDNALDVVVGNGGGQISVMLGNGAGGFGAPTSYAVAAEPYSVTLADFDGSGTLDVAAAHWTSDSVTILFNSAGMLGSPKVISVAEDPRGITAADFNNDGRIDIATANRVEFASNNGSKQGVSVLINSGGGNFAPAVHYDSHGSPETIATGDVNRDGVVDLLVGGWDTSQVTLLGNNDGTFSRPVHLVGEDSEYASIAADFNGDGFGDVAIVSYFSDMLNVLLSQPNNPRNDRVTMFGEISDQLDRDFYSLKVAAGQTFTFDVEAAEFQYTLDAQLDLFDANGNLLVTSRSGLDRDSGLDSADPYVTHTFSSAGTVRIAITGERGSIGHYRLKVTPTTAYEVDPPRVIAAYPDNGASVDGTVSWTFFLDGQLDPATINSSSVVIQGATSGIRSGTAKFNPLDSTLIWTADQQLPPDTYTATLSSAVNGLRDLRGNRIDGEIAANFRFPQVSGDGLPGGDFVSRMTVTAVDNTPAQLNFAIRRLDLHQRTRISHGFDDELSPASAESAIFTARGQGPDGRFDTADDRLVEFDVVFNKMLQFQSPRIEVYSRGYMDSDYYRIEGRFLDAAGLNVNVNYIMPLGNSVPQRALFQDSNLTQPGLVASFVNSSLRNVTSHADWRTTQTISGTRIDNDITFESSSFGVRSTVGITGGTDADWQNFSVQWDGWVDVPADGIRIQTVSDDGSRMWIDVNGDGAFGADITEFVDNGWGTGHALATSEASIPLAKGKYRIRIQYEEGDGFNSMAIQWIAPDFNRDYYNLSGGPSVVGMNITPGTVEIGSIRDVQVMFSSSLDLASLTPANLKLRYSPDTKFFDGDDVYIADADGAITWDAIRRTATLTTAQPLAIGYYLVELNGSATGIRGSNGIALDGEFTSTYVLGNTNSSRMNKSPSGDGIPGGDYRAFFVIGNPVLDIQISPSSISEKDGTATVTIQRLNATDINTSQIVNLTSSDTSEATIVATATIPAGQYSVTVPLMGVDDNLLDGNQLVTITATAAGFQSKSTTVTVTDYEAISIQTSNGTISEKGGSVQVTVTRPGNVGLQSFVLAIDKPSKLDGRSTVTVQIPNGQTSQTITLNAIDNAIVDGNQLVTLSVTAIGMVATNTQVIVSDHEELTLVVASPAISEAGGTTTGRVRRTDPRGTLTVTLTSLSPDEATMPSTVTIADGQLESASFNINAVNDLTPDGNQQVTLQASAIGYFNGTATLEVQDAERLILVFDTPSINENGGKARVKVRRNDTRGTLLVTLQADAPGRVTMPATILMADGQRESAEFEITAVDNNLVEGTRLVGITASAVGYQPTTVQLNILDHEQLSFELLGLASISERGGRTSAVIRRTDSIGELVVNLSTNDNSEASVPPTIRIPDGQLVSPPFFIDAVDDDILDGSQSVILTSRATGYINATTELQILDYETLTLQLATNSISERGGVSRLTVTRSDLNALTDLLVQLTGSDPTEASVPATITIPALRRSATVDVLAVDDQLLDGLQSLSISASALGYQPVELTRLDVTDFEELTISVDRSSASEFGGIFRTTVTRNNTDNGQPLQVDVSTSARLTSPTTLTIEAGQSSVVFDVLANDDSLLTGDAASSIAASAVGYQDATQAVTITDFESLTMSLSVSSITEAVQTVSATIRRSNTNNSEALVVNLASSDTSEVTLPAQATIPAGQDSITVNATSVDDTLLDGTQLATLTATANGYQSGTAQLSIDDFEPLVLSFGAGAISENGGRLSATISRPAGNLGQALSIDLRASNGDLEIPATVIIPIGQLQANFDIVAMDDNLLNGTRTSPVIASANGFVSSEKTVTLTDHEPLSIELSTGSISEFNGRTTITISRGSTLPTSEVLVQLTNNDDSELMLPLTAIIPVGQSSITVEATANDDALIDGTQTVTVAASADGYIATFTTVLVTDFEPLRLTASATSISELGGRTIIEVDRGNTELSRELVVSLNSSDSLQLHVPSTLTIAAGQSSGTFVATAVDDARLDGLQKIVVTAFATGFVSASQSIDVLDHETLSIAFAAASIEEQGGSLTGTISRTADIGQELIVTLSQSSGARIDIPATVQLAAGFNSVNFSIRSADNFLYDGNQVVTVSAQATGYGVASTNLEVLDNETRHPWQNPRKSLDVNNDGFVTALDALLIISRLSSQRTNVVPIPSEEPRYFYDVNGDNFVVPLDVLLIIDHLNRTSRGGEGEAATGNAQVRIDNDQRPVDSSSGVLLLDIDLHERQRRRTRDRFFGEYHPD